MRSLRHLAFISLLMFILVAIQSPHANAADTKNCSDFNSQADAQAYFDKHGGSKSNNVDSLDADHDGVACEDLKRSGTIEKTVDTATGGGIGTGIAIGVVLCLAAIAGFILWLYKRRPSSSVALSPSIGSDSSSGLKATSHSTVGVDGTAVPALGDSPIDPISAQDDPYSPENLSAATESTSAPIGTTPPLDPHHSPDETVARSTEVPPTPVQVAPTGMLVLTIKTADSAAIPPTALLSIGSDSRSLASASGSSSIVSTFELTTGSHAYAITGAAPYADSQANVEILSNDVVRVTATLTLTPQTLN